MIRVENLYGSYGYVEVLKDINIEVGDKEIVCVIGANGAGKTTLLKTISGLIHPVKGTIYLRDQDITHLPPHRIVGLGISQVPEGRQIFASLTVMDNLVLGSFARYRKVSKGDIHQDLEKVSQIFPRLKERSKQRAGTLSGGEQQMLTIGRALMARPRVLLLDEPSLGLAPLILREIFRVLSELHEQGIPLLLVEQNAMVALEISHRGYVMENGRMVMSGTGRELRENDRVKEAYLGAKVASRPE